MRAQVDEYILQCDYLVLGKVVSDSTSVYSLVDQRVTRHFCHIATTRIYKANWKIVADTTAMVPGSIIRNVKVGTSDSTFHFPKDSILFFALRSRGQAHFWLSDDMTDPKVYTDTSLFGEYAFRKNPDAHLPFPIITQEPHDRWWRVSEYNGDSVLLSTIDLRSKPGSPLRFYQRYRFYNEQGEITHRAVSRRKQWSDGHFKEVIWCFRRDDKFCILREIERFPPRL